MNKNEIYIVKNSQTTVDTYFRKKFPGLVIVREEYIYRIKDSNYRLIECSSQDISGVRLFMLKKVVTYEMCLEDAKKYKTLPEWRFNDKTTYFAAYSRGWMDKIIEETGLPRRKSRGTLAYSTLLEIAKQFNSIQEWVEKDFLAYKNAKNKNFLQKLQKDLHYDILTIDYTGQGKVRTKNLPPTYDQCLYEAKKHKTISDWENNHQKTYHRAFRQKWIDRIIKEAGIERQRKKHDYYTILEDAKTFKTSIEWRNARKAEYSWIYINGLLDKLKDEAGYKKINELYTFEECVEDAKLFNNLTQWRKGGKTFRCAEDNDWLDEITERTGYLKGAQKKLWWYDINK